MRRAFKEKEYKEKGAIDKKLDHSIKVILNKCPEEWEEILFYIRSLAIPVDVDGNCQEDVVAQYNQKLMASKIAKRFYGFETRGE